ncbi:MAG: hypothetical protein ACE149_07690 [Armatimonadota bacterium]
MLAVAAVFLTAVCAIAPEAQGGIGRGQIGPPARSSYEGPAPEPAVTLDMLPDHEKLRERLLALFSDPRIIRVTIKAGQSRVTMEGNVAGKRAWKLMVEGVRQADPGLAIPELSASDRETAIWLSVRPGPGAQTQVKRLWLTGGMLHSDEIPLGASIRTLAVSPEFERGLRLVLQQAGIEPLPPPDLRPTAIWPVRPAEQPFERSARVDRQGALRAAQRFASAAGLPLGERPYVGPLGEAEGRFPPTWVVSNGNFAWVIVDALGGQVISAQNSSAQTTNRAAPRKDGPSAKQIVRTARRVLGALDVARGELGDEEVWPSGDVRVSQRPDECGTSVRVTWPRVLRAGGRVVPYWDERVSVVVAGGTGEVVEAQRLIRDREVSVDSVSVTAARARELAQERVGEIYGTGQTWAMREIQLRVVTPNQWPDEQGSRSEEIPGIPNRIAWVVEGELGGLGVFGLFLDAADGRLIGGYGVIPREAGVQGRDAAPRRERAARKQEGGALLLVAVGCGAALLVLVVVVSFWPKRRATLADSDDTGSG